MPKKHLNTSQADLAVLSIFLIKPVTSSYCSVILFSTASIRSSRLANLFSIRLCILVDFVIPGW